jgi:DNA-binding MarR family transcriptional regulator
MASVDKSSKGPERMGLERETGFLLQLAHQRARRAFNEALAPLHIQAKHVGVLATLSGNRPFNQKELADQLELDKSMVVLIVDDLERLQLAHRHRDASDRRAHALQITEKGRQVTKSAMRIAAVVNRKVLDGFSHDGRRRFNQALLRVIQNCKISRGEKGR